MYPPPFPLSVLGVYTKGTILPVRPDRRLHSRDWCQRLLLPTARHPACAGYILRHLRAQCTLTLPGQSVCVCFCKILCLCVVVYMLSQAQAINLTEKQNCLLQTACTVYLFDTMKIILIERKTKLEISTMTQHDPFCRASPEPDVRNMCMFSFHAYITKPFPTSVHVSTEFYTSIAYTV